MMSPGREPREHGGQILNKPPKGPTDTLPKRSGSIDGPGLSPLRGSNFLRLPNPGLTPRAKHLPPLRGSHPLRLHRPISSKSG